MQAALSRAPDGSLQAACDGRVYHASHAFDGGEIKRAASPFAEGRALRRALPARFLRQVERRCAGKNPQALVLTLMDPELAVYRWEYVPTRGDDEELIGNTWGVLPLLRSLPGSSYGPRAPQPDGVNGARACFFHDLRLHALPPFATATGVNSSEEYNGENVKGMGIEGQREKLLRYLGRKASKVRKDFAYLVTHARPDAFLLLEDGNPLLAARELDQLAFFPRVVLADGCRTAEVPDGKGWGDSLAGGFIAASRGAVYIGNIGEAIYSDEQNGTCFARLFLEEFYTASRNRPFDAIIREVRRRQSERGDAHNTQVVYVSGGWDVTALRSELLEDAVLRAPRRFLQWPVLFLFLASLLSFLPLFYLWQPGVFRPVGAFCVSVAGLVGSTAYGLRVIMKQKK